MIWERLGKRKKVASKPWLALGKLTVTLTDATLSQVEIPSETPETVNDLEFFRNWPAVRTGRKSRK